MFFTEAVAAFTNVARAVRPGARLVLIVQQSRDRNEWAIAVQGVLAPGDSQSAAYDARNLWCFGVFTQAPPQPNFRTSALWRRL